jgi:hypothetical protein
MATGWIYYNAMWMDRMDNGAIAVEPSPNAKVYAVGREAIRASGATATGRTADVGGFSFEEVTIPDGMVAFSPFSESRSASREPIL